MLPLLRQTTSSPQRGHKGSPSEEKIPGHSPNKSSVLDTSKQLSLAGVEAAETSEESARVVEHLQHKLGKVRLRQLQDKLGEIQAKQMRKKLNQI